MYTDRIAFSFRRSSFSFVRVSILDAQFSADALFDAPDGAYFDRAVVFAHVLSVHSPGTCFFAFLLFSFLASGCVVVVV